MTGKGRLPLPPRPPRGGRGACAEWEEGGAHAQMERAMGLGGRVTDRGQVATWLIGYIGRAIANDALTPAPKQGQGEQRG